MARKAGMMDGPCPAAEKLVAFVEDSLPEGDRGPLLAHLEACPGCRADVAAAAQVLQGRGQKGRPRRLLPLAAAAVLLLAVSLLSLSATESPSRSRKPRPDPATAGESPFPAAPSQGAVLAGRGGVEIPLGCSALLTLREGSRVELAPGTVILREGDVGLESRGDPLKLALPGGAELALEDAALVVSTYVAPREAWLWISEACAGEASGRVSLLRGTARLACGGREVLIRAGQESDLEASDPRPAGPLAWRPRETWRSLPGLPLRLKDDVFAPPGPPAGGGYAWEALARRTEASALFSVVWASDGKVWHLPLGQGALGEAGPWMRIRLEATAGWVRLLVGGREVLRSRQDALDGCAYVGKPLEAYPGLSVHGGEVEVAEGRWRLLP